MNLDILFEDNHIIVVYKPAGILSQADGSNKEDMLTIIKKYLVTKYNKPGEAYLGLVHRLDINTSGVMVFAKTSKAASRLSESIKNNDFSKKYLAIIKTNKRLKLKDTLIDYLSKDESTNTSYISNETIGKKAILNYNILIQLDDYSLVEIELITGRHHQIRVQFSARNSSLYGDVKYGGEKNDSFELGLQAYELAFVHPTTKENLTFNKINNNGIWKMFNK